VCVREKATEPRNQQQGLQHPPTYLPIRPSHLSPHPCPATSRSSTHTPSLLPVQPVPSLLLPCLGSGLGARVHGALVCAQGAHGRGVNGGCDGLAGRNGGTGGPFLAFLLFSREPLRLICCRGPQPGRQARDSCSLHQPIPCTLLSLFVPCRWAHDMILQPDLSHWNVPVPAAPSSPVPIPHGAAGLAARLSNHGPGEQSAGPVGDGHSRFQRHLVSSLS
jgi:hypothetical protein